MSYNYTLHSLVEEIRKGNLDGLRANVDWYRVTSGTSVSYPILKQKDNDGRTLLMHAAKEGHPQMVKYLLERGSDRADIDNEGNNVFHFATESDNALEVMRELDPSANPDHATKKNKDGTTPFMLAAAGKSTEVATLLANADKSKIAEMDRYGFDALIYAINSGKSKEMLPHLDSLGMKREKKLTKEQEELQLFFATLHQNTPLVKSLESSGIRYDHFLNSYWRDLTLAKETGHVMGISQRVKTSETDELVSTERFYPVQAGMLFQKILPMLQTIDESARRYLPRISEMTDALVNYLKFNGSVTEQDLLARHQQGKPTLLRAEFPGHAFGVIIYKDFLAIVNRGDGKLNKGISYFKIPDSKKILINAEFIKNLKQKSKSGLMGLLGRVVDLNNPLFTEQVKDQRHGTCAFVNIYKSSMLAALYFMIQEDFLKNTQLLSSLGLDQSVEFNMKLVPAIQKNAFPVYKRLTTLMRDAWVGFLVSLYKQSLNNNEKQFIFSLLQSIVVEHHRNSDPKKNKIVLERIFMIVKALELDDLRKLLLNLSKGNLYLFSLAMDSDHSNLATFLSDPSIYDSKLSSKSPQSMLKKAITDPDLTALQKLLQFPKIKEYLANYKGIFDYNRNYLFLIITNMTNNDIPMLKELLKVINPNQPDSLGETPLIYAIKNNKMLAFDPLITSGVDVNNSDREGNTPLILVIRHFPPREAFDAIKKLKDKGALFNVKNKQGQDLLHFINEKIELEEGRRKTCAEKGETFKDTNLVQYKEMLEFSNKALASSASAGAGVSTVLTTAPRKLPGT